MNECRKGGCSSIMGCAENKRKKKDGARVWAYGFWLGWFGSWVGSGEVYKGYNPFSFIFLTLFSLFLPHALKPYVLSLLHRFFFSDEKWVGGGGGAVADRLRRRRRRPKCLFLKKNFSSFSYTPSPLHVSGLKISKLFIKMPRSKKRKKGNLYFCFFFVFRFWFVLQRIRLRELFVVDVMFCLCRLVWFMDL